MSHLFLVRHSTAGERRLWNGDDVHRPLSKKGWKQSAAIAKRLAKVSPSNLYSSPYVRCIQTLEPLGELVGVDVEVDQRLCEEEPFEPVLDMLAEVPAHSVLCSHGDIIPAVMQALQRRGTRFNTPPDWRKATVWIVNRNRKGQIVSATVRPPPTL
jgi:8-oxo-dGTP diphosphatase